MDREDTRQRTLAGLLVAAVLAVAGWQFFHWWTRPTAVEFDNLSYIQLLTTAVSSRSPEMVGKVETAIRLRHESGAMSDKELAHFQRIIGVAREGKWPNADKACFEFAEAQLNRARSRPASDGHSHDHGREEQHEHPQAR